MSLLLHPATSIAITPLGPADEAEWDAFVLAHPDATLCHRAAWTRILRDSFGYR